MARIFSREEIREKLNALTANNEPIVVSDVGAGITAKFAQAGGADMISMSVGGYYRMDTIGSVAGIMPFKNANDVLLQLADRVLPRIKDVPACAGAALADPTRELLPFIGELRRLGFSAVINSPSMGCVTGNFRDNCENGNIAVKQELKYLAEAGKMGFFTVANVYEPEYARMAAENGVDAMVVNLGVSELNGRRTSLEDAAEKVNEVASAALGIKPDIIVLVHGGPIITPEDTAYIYRHTPAVGFFGESVLETVPAAQPIIDTVRKFGEARIDVKEGK